MNRSRQGYSLIELMLAMTITLAAMAVCVSTLFHILPLTDRAKSRVEQTGELMALAEQFRQDAHGAAQLTDDNDAPLPAGKLQTEWFFKNPAGETIHYQVAGEELLRVASATNRPGRRDSFVLPNAAVKGLELNSVGGRELAALVVQLEGARLLRIEAVVDSFVVVRSQKAATNE